MGFDFTPVNDGMETFHLGAFSWSWMLETGVGLILGQQSDNIGSFIYNPREAVVPGEDGEPDSVVKTAASHNDGFPVSDAEAKAIALALRGLAYCERYRLERWNNLSAEERSEIESFPTAGTFVRKDGTYDFRPFRKDHRIPIREDFIELAVDFADWAERSGGFQIH